MHYLIIAGDTNLLKDLWEMEMHEELVEKHLCPQKCGRKTREEQGRGRCPEKGPDVCSGWGGRAHWNPGGFGCPPAWIE